MAIRLFIHKDFLDDGMSTWIFQLSTRGIDREIVEGARNNIPAPLASSILYNGDSQTNDNQRKAVCSPGVLHDIPCTVHPCRNACCYGDFAIFHLQVGMKLESSRPHHDNPSRQSLQEKVILNHHGMNRRSFSHTVQHDSSGLVDLQIAAASLRQNCTPQCGSVNISVRPETTHHSFFPEDSIIVVS